MDKGYWLILVAAFGIIGAVISSVRHSAGVYEGTWTERCKHVQCLDNSKAKWFVIDDKDSCVCVNSSQR